ncbi:MAG: hypothetical protein KDB18_05225 [Salinibacterium sp.]|nr:hypothetical protein [Salinibacterium sp.]
MSNNQAVSFLDVNLLAVAGIVLLVDLIVFARTFRKISVVAMVDKLERTVGLAIPEELRSSIGRHLLRRQRIRLAFIFFTTIAMVVVVFTVSFPDASYRSFVLVGGVVAGSVIGIAMGSLHWPAQLERDALHVAKARAVSLDDYVAPWERRSARTFVGLSMIIYVASLLVAAWGSRPVHVLLPATSGGLFTGLAVLFLAVFEVVGRRTVGRAQVSGSESELVWDDALRAIDVRSLASTPATIGLLGVLFGASNLTLQLHDFLAASGLLLPVTIAGWIGFAGVLVLTIAWAVSSPERHFLRRLWPAYVLRPFIEPGVVTSRSLPAERRESES